jgi:alpha-tubulin suppressor-like RCC1 family protein
MDGSVIPSDTCPPGLCLDGDCIECGADFVPFCDLEDQMAPIPVSCVSNKLTKGAACKENLCKAGACLECGASELRCSGDQPQNCSVDGQFVDNGSVCPAGLCKDGICLGCKVGDKACNGDQPQTCDGGTNKYVDAGAACGAGLCSNGDCLTCVPGADYCDGDVLKRCDATGLSPSTLATCGTGGCDSTAALCNECTPGSENTCNGQALQSCSQYGQFVTEKTCAPGTTCAAENVGNECQFCTPVEFSCTGAGVLHQCNANGTSFASTQDCGQPELCDAIGGVCAKCVAGTFQCSGATLQECNPASGYQQKEACASAALCNAAKGACDPASCTLNSVRCSGKELQKCLDSASYTTTKTCAVNEMCDPSANGSGACITPAQVSAGGYHTCAVMSDGTVACWGRNVEGQLGSSTTSTLETSPKRVVIDAGGKTLLTKAVLVASGAFHSCALTSDGDIYCWGYGKTGALGTAAPKDNFRSYAAKVTTGVKFLVPSPNGSAQALSAGGYSTCAIAADTSVYCWGENDYGQLGIKSFTNAFAPTKVYNIVSGVTSVSITTEHSCIVVNGYVKCSGSNSSGQLGSPNTGTTSNVPVYVFTNLAGSTYLSGATAIAAGGFETSSFCLPPCTPVSYPYGHTCAMVGGSVYCWGENADGQLGNNSQADRSYAAITSSPSNFSSLKTITAGAHHTCAGKSGSIWCWGQNSFLQTGTTTDTTVDTKIPSLVPSLSLGSSVTAASAGDLHTCGIIPSVSGITCWGANAYGQVGDGTKSTSSTPKSVVFPLPRSSMNRPRLLLLSASFVALASVTCHAPRLARAQLPPAPSGEVAVSPDAKRHFQAGVALLQDPEGSRYEEAFREFRIAYDLSPSWKILGNLGICAMKLERNGDAIEAFERYLAASGKDIDATERAQVEKDLSVLKTVSAAVTLSSDARAETTITDKRVRADGKTSLNTYVLPAGKSLKLFVQGGRHTFVAKADGKEARWEDDVSAAKPAEHKFLFAAAPMASGSGSAAPAAAPAAEAAPSSSGSTLRTAGYVTAGVGGALVLGGVVTGLIGKGRLSDLDSKCPNKTCAAQSDIDSVKSMQTLTNVFWISGAVLAAGGVAMIVLGKPGAATESATTGVRVVPSVGPGAAGLAAFGRF